SRFSQEMSAALRIDVTPVKEARDATRESGVIVTATPARAPFLNKDMVRKGAFIAAVGTDSADKSELEPELMSVATIVVDLIGQAAAMGDLHHAIEAGLGPAAVVHAEFGELLLRRKARPTSAHPSHVIHSTRN